MGGEVLVGHIIAQNNDLVNLFSKIYHGHNRLEWTHNDMPSGLIKWCMTFQAKTDKCEHAQVLKHGCQDSESFTPPEHKWFLYIILNVE